MTELACRTRRTGRDEQETEQGGGKGKKEGEMAPPGGCQGSSQWPLAPLPLQSLTTTSVAFCTHPRTGSPPLAEDMCIVWTRSPAHLPLTS